MADTLKPFVRVESDTEAIPDKVVDEGIYNFLSPLLLPQPISREKIESGDFPVSVALPNMPPEWYQRGQHVGDLLKVAEELDWAKDAGCAIEEPIIQPQPTRYY